MSLTCRLQAVIDLNLLIAMRARANKGPYAPATRDTQESNEVLVVQASTVGLWHGFWLRGVQPLAGTRSVAPLARPPEALPEV